MPRERAIPPSRPPNALKETAALFFRLGVTAFGGPAAHIAMMRQEVVVRRRWMDEQEFLDLLGATNLIPGPNSTEMAIHLGYRRAGWPGLIVAGVLFITPAMVIVLAFAWAYVRYGGRPEATALLYGVKPVIIAVVLQAVWGLARTAVKSVVLGVTGGLVGVLYLLGFNEIGLLFVGGILAGLGEAWRRRAVRPAAGLAVLLSPLLGQAATSATAFSHATLFFTFLKIGAVLYGSGYVLLAFLRNDFVNRLGWLSDQQLLDAVSVGQFTPGPVFTTATFIGYLVGGWGGGILATIGIFLPSFVFVAATGPLVPRLRRSVLAGRLLDGVNVAALGLMAAVTWELGRAAVVDWPTALIAAIAAGLLIRWRAGSVWLIAAGAAIGLAVHALGP